MMTRILPEMTNTILIVDPDRDAAHVLARRLEDAGYPAVTVSTGSDMLRLLQAGTFSLVLFDLKQHRDDETSLVEELCRLYPALPVIMMTGDGCEETLFEMGIVDAVKKPFSFEVLLRRIRRLLRHSRVMKENLELGRKVEEDRGKADALLDGVADFLVVVDCQERIITMNRCAEELLGISADEVQGRILSELLRSDMPPDQFPSRLVLKDGEPCRNVEFILHSVKGDIPMLSSGAAFRAGSGELAGCVMIAHDISAIKLLECERSDFVSMLSHDLKSPITAIVGSIDLVREGRLGPVNTDQKEYLDSAIESCGEMVEMIDNLLDVHKLESGRLNLVFRAEEPHALIAKGVARYRSLARKAELDLTTTVPQELPEVMVDRAKFHRLLGNLLSNALKFTKEGGAIAVSAEVVESERIRGRIPSDLYPPGRFSLDGSYLMMTVSDTGIGIEESSRTVIFDRYVQAQQRRRTRSGGSGLGLAFCRKMMDAHRGFIWVESELHKGSSFITLFPLSPPGS